MIRTLFNFTLILILFVCSGFAQTPQFTDGTTLIDFVLDNNGYAFFKVAQNGSLRPAWQARFIADPGNSRGGNALHPESHGAVVAVVNAALKATGSTGKTRVAWINSVGFAGGWHVFVNSERGELSINLADLACQLMKQGWASTLDSVTRHFRTVL